MCRLLIPTAMAAMAATVTTMVPAAADSPEGAYLLIEVKVTDPTAFNDYAEKATEMVGRYGGTFVVMGGRARSVEGAPPAGNVVVIRFEKYEGAERWLDSEEYARIKTIRHNSAQTRQILVEAVGENE
jgi:uncharacterized protein (DUF1330 family)